MARRGSAERKVFSKAMKTVILTLILTLPYVMGGIILAFIGCNFMVWLIGPHETCKKWGDNGEPPSRRPPPPPAPPTGNPNHLMANKPRICPHCGMVILFLTMLGLGLAPGASGQRSTEDIIQRLPPAYRLQFDGQLWRYVCDGFVSVIEFNTADEAISAARRLYANIPDGVLHEVYERKPDNKFNFTNWPPIDLSPAKDVPKPMTAREVGLALIAAQKDATDVFFVPPQPVDPPPTKPDTNSAGLALQYAFSPCGDADIKCWHVPEVLTNWHDLQEEGTNMLQAGVITSNYLLLAQWRDTPIHTNVLFTSNLVLQSLPMRVAPKPVISVGNIWFTNQIKTNLWFIPGTSITPL